MAASKKSVIVTGGASGIGLGITRYFAEQGANITVLDINASTGPDVVKSVATDFPNASVVFKKCDISSWDEQASVFKEVYQEQGRIDVVMANAGITEKGKLIMNEDEPSKPTMTTLDVNLIGTIYSVKLAIHYLRKNEANPSRGTIICTASNAGIYCFPIAPIYSATKHAVIGLVRSLARPLVAEAIQINALAPSVLETNIAPSKDLFKTMILTPMTTLTNGVAKLVSDSSLTGQVAEIHGDSVTLRDQPDYVDADSEKNLENFWTLGYA